MNASSIRILSSYTCFYLDCIVRIANIRHFSLIYLKLLNIHAVKYTQQRLPNSAEKWFFILSLGVFFRLDTFVLWKVFFFSLFSCFFYNDLNHLLTKPRLCWRAAVGPSIPPREKLLLKDVVKTTVFLMETVAAPWQPENSLQLDSLVFSGEGAPGEKHLNYREKFEPPKKSITRRWRSARLQWLTPPACLHPQHQ